MNVEDEEERGEDGSGGRNSLKPTKKLDGSVEEFGWRGPCRKNRF